MSGASPASTSMTPPPTSTSMTLPATSTSMTPPPTSTSMTLPATSTSMTPPPNSVVEKPVIVRVKRKASQARIDGFWLEINEKPLKKPFLDLASLSISDSETKKEVLATKKMLVHHLETVGQSQSIKDALHSVLQSSNNTKEEFKRRSKERRSLLKADKKHDQLLSVARKEHEDLARSARFEQIWKRRRSIDAEESSLREGYHLYDVVQVDAEDETRRKQKPIHAPDGDGAILLNYLSLIREFLPEAAEEIEHEIETTEDNFVYDLYTVGDSMGTDMNTSEYPLVQVDDDDDCYDDPQQSDYESDDSNAEDNPRNDYPDEESSEDVENEDPFIDLEDSNSDYEPEEIYPEEEDREDWRWGYR